MRRSRYVLINVRHVPHLSAYRTISMSSRLLSVKATALGPIHPRYSPETNPWIRVKDPNGSNFYYYWNTLTNEATPLGCPKPDHWVEVVDKQSLFSYWWNVDTDETTPLGANRPSPFPHINAYMQALEEAEHPTLAGSMGIFLLIGISMSLGAIMVRRFIE
jgi:hypothetical protein